MYLAISLAPLLPVTLFPNNNPSTPLHNDRPSKRGVTPSGPTTCLHKSNTPLDPPLEVLTGTTTPRTILTFFFGTGALVLKYEIKGCNSSIGHGATGTSSGVVTKTLGGIARIASLSSNVNRGIFSSSRPLV